MPKATQLVTRQAVAALLSTKSNRDKLFDADAVGKLLSVAVDADDNDSISIDVVTLVSSAFAEGRGEYESVLAYTDYSFIPFYCRVARFNQWQSMHIYHAQTKYRDMP